MDVGSSLAVFLVLAFVLLALFCILTKYFHHKMNQNIEEAAQIYSMVEEVGYQDLENQNEGNYDQFKGMQLQQIIKADNRHNPGYQEIQMADMFMRTPINNSHQDIYSPQIQNNRPINNMIPRNMETGRSMSSLRQFKPDKLITTNRTNRTNKDPDEAKRGLLDKNYPKSDYENQNYHTFVNKMVCYDSQGITVVQVDVISIRKVGEGAFKENRIVKSYLTTNHEKGFDDQLEIFGFEKTDFGCFKYLTKVQTQNMKINEQYAIKSLKTCEIKQSMEVQDYLRVKMQLQNNP